MKYENQFMLVPPSERIRTTIDMPLKLDAQLKALEPKTGVLQTTISILLTKLSDELRKSNIEPGDRYAYQAAVANATLNLGGDAGQRVPVTVAATGLQSVSAPETFAGNDRRRSKQVARKTPRP